MTLDKFIYSSPNLDYTLRLNKTVDFIITPLRIAFAGRIYHVLDIDEQIKNVRQVIQKTASCSRRIFCLLAAIVLAPVMISAVAIKFSLSCNSKIQKLFQAKYFPFNGRRYRGELVNNKPQGQGAMYDANEVILYSGTWKSGHAHGKGTSYHGPKKIWYEGDWKNNEKHGRGKSYGEDGRLRYDGQWKNNLPNGQGTAFHPNGKPYYAGSWADSAPHGKGKSFDDQGRLRYEGEMVEGNPHGQGFAYDEQGNGAASTWENGRRRFSLEGI